MNKGTTSFNRIRTDKVVRFLKKNVPCWLYIIPVLVGIIFFTIVPMCTSIDFAFHPKNLKSFEQIESGFTFKNFELIFTKEPKGIWDTFIRSLGVTFGFTIVSLSLQILGSYTVALFLNQKTKGIKTFRILYYLPNLIPAIAGTLLWANITSERGGYLNILLDKFFGVNFPFYSDPDTVLPTLLIINVFSWGGTAIMWLSQMQNIPQELYESADLDGANYFHKTFKITIPMSTSMMFYVIVTSMIGGIQAYTNVYPLYEKFGGEPNLNFIVVYIYNTAFKGDMDMSLACALSWILFLVIGLMTLFLFKTSKKWVYYGEEA